MESTHPTERVVVIIDDDEDDLDQLKATHLIPRPINTASERSPASPFHHSTAKVTKSRYSTTKHELPLISSWTSRASFSNPLGESTILHTQESSAKSNTADVDTFPKCGNRGVASDTWVWNSFDSNRSSIPCSIPSPRVGSVSVRNKSIAAPWRSLESFSFRNIKVNPKANVELRDGDFMRVLQIIQDTRTSEVSLRGWIFRRAKLMNGMLDHKLNEVCWILHVDENDKRNLEVQGMESVLISDVVKRRRIRMTNRPYPQLSWREDPIETVDVVANERGLVCRFKYVCYYPDARARERYEWSEKSLQRIRADECDPTCGMADEELRHNWRGDTIKGGACKGLVPGEVAFLRNERQYQNDCERLDTRKRQQSSLSTHGPQYPSEPRRGSAASLISELNLAQGPGCVIDDDLQEIDPPLLMTKVSDRLKLQPSPKRVGSATTPCAEKNLSVKNRYRSFSREDKPDQLEFQEICKPEFLHVAKRQKTSSHTSANDLIDLTHDEPKQGAELCSLFDTARSGHLNGTGRHVRSSRYPSPEVVEVRAQIDTSCKLGTMRREYQGQITSTYLPNHSNPLKRSPNSKLVISELSKGNSPRAMTNLPVKKWDENSSLLVPLAADSRPRPPPVSQDHTRLSSVVGQRYTFGDCFCGAGGTSRGAVDAGLRVEWGFDFDDSACRSYGLNYIAADVYNIDAHRFSSLTDKDHKVDICHLSPPCQYFSDAHTTPGKDDEKNVASLFAVSELLDKAKPRVVTLEQTAGLSRRHGIFLNAVINMFTTRGFSIRWRLIDCADYGIPQRRLRLFMIASCPGECLPTIPKSTHTSDTSRQPGLKPWKTINQAISSIPSNCANHDIASVRNVDGIPYDGDTQARCITTSGGGMIHPSGLRNFTHRELACLQGFPLEQKFHHSGAKRQIGNAVPPMVAKVILEEVKRALMKADGIP